MREKINPPIVGQMATLEENDYCGTKTVVKVLRIYKGENALVLDGELCREVAVNRLSALETPVKKEK